MAGVHRLAVDGCGALRAPEDERIVETADDYETAWRRAGEARQGVPEQIFFVMSTETREIPTSSGK